MRYDFESFEAGALPDTVINTIFSQCEFTGRLPNFYNCEFHDCDLTNTKVGDMVNCKLYATNLDGADFSRANLFMTLTHSGSPCSAKNCRWEGIAATFDCRFLEGLQLDEDAAWSIVALALIPASPAREAILKAIPRKHRRRLLALLSRPFRTR